MNAHKRVLGWVGSRFRGKNLVYTVLTLLSVVSIGSTVFLAERVNALKQDPQAQAKRDTAALVDKVGQLIMLPADETPTVATVSDPTKLQDQAFFADAKAGDKVLIYLAAKKAYLYDPTVNKLVDETPVTTGSGAATGTTAAPTKTTATK